MGIQTSQRAAGDVAGYVTAGSHGGQARGEEGFKHLGKILDGDPVQLDILSDGDVGNSTGVFFRQISNRAHLRGIHEAVGEADTDHEVGCSLAFAAATAESTGAIPLRVDAPPAEVGLDPLIGDSCMAMQSELADLIDAFPWILLP